MPTLDKNTQMNVKTSNGDIVRVFPNTKIENVEGLQSALNGKVTSVKVGSTSYNPSSGIVSLPAYPTTLPASDVYSWAKASSKPTYTASEVGAIATSAKGAASGVAELDSNGKVPASQLPSYVDDVLEYSAKSSFPTTGETGKIYVDTSDNKTYRWSGTAYVEISPSLALGTTSSTAYRGDRGNTAYSHATDSSRLTTATSSGLYKVASTAQGHIASLTAVAKADITALGIPAQDTTYSAATTSTAGLMSASDKTKLNGIATGATANIGTVTQVKVGSTAYNPSSGVVSLPAYPTTLPASDVYSWAKTSSKPSYTASEVGLGNVGNYKAVSTVASQGLNDTEKSNARANIGAGTSSFSGSYNDLSNKPTIPTKTSQLTNDSGYTTNTGTVTGVKVGSTSYSPSSGIVSLPAYPTTLPASDVYSWAKASSKPSYTASDVGLGNVGNFKAVSTVASQGLSSTEKSNARANIGAGTSSFSGSYSDLSNKPTIPTKTSQLTNDSGYTTNTGTVTGVKVGSTSYSPSSGIVSLPAYPTDTHRPIQVNGSQILGNNTTAVNLTQGGHVRITSPSTGTVKFNLADWVVYHDIEVSLSSLSWTSYGGSYYSSNIDLGNYISYMLGATVLDYSGISPSTVVPCIGGSTSTVWLWASTGSFSADATLKIRAFGIYDYNDG